MKKKNPLTQHASIIKKRKAEKNYALRVKKQYYKQLKNSSNEQPVNVSNSTEAAEDQALKMRKQIDDLFEGKYDRERMEDGEDVDEELKINQISRKLKRNNSDSEMEEESDEGDEESSDEGSNAMKLASKKPKTEKSASKQKNHKPNPYQKLLDEKERKMREAAEEKLKREQEKKEQEERKKQRKQKASKLLKRTRKGQPIIKNLMEHILEKIKQG